MVFKSRKSILVADALSRAPITDDTKKSDVRQQPIARKQPTSCRIKSMFFCPVCQRSVKTCTVCNHTKPNSHWNHSHNTPFQNGTDLFHHAGKVYLITVDYFSNFFKIPARSFWYLRQRSTVLLPAISHILKKWDFDHKTAQPAKWQSSCSRNANNKKRTHMGLLNLSNTPQERLESSQGLTDKEANKKLLFWRNY